MEQNENIKNGFETWQKYSDAYTRFAVEATQRTLAQSLALREQFDNIVADSFKWAQALNAREQEIALNAIESFQAQAQTATERLTRLFNTNSQN